MILNIGTAKLSDNSSECPDKNSTSPKFLRVSSVIFTSPPHLLSSNPPPRTCALYYLEVQEPRHLPTAPTEFTCHGALPRPSKGHGPSRLIWSWNRNGECCEASWFACYVATYLLRVVRSDRCVTLVCILFLLPFLWFLFSLETILEQLSQIYRLYKNHLNMPYTGEAESIKLPI